MQTICLSNHKGGVAKTTTTRALGAVLAETRRVLMIDIDPQASLTGACGVQEAADGNMAHVLGGAQRSEVGIGDVLFRLTDRLFLAPGDITLARCELGLVSRMGRERVLARALAPMREHFDICLIDTPPSLGLLTVNALCASDYTIVPSLPEVMSLRGLRLFIDTLDEVREEMNPRLALLGVLITMADLRTIHHQDAIQAIKEAGYPVFETIIGRSIKVSESAIGGASVTDYAPDNPQARAYRALAEEVMSCLSVTA
jgi:chromosome partitioning protein